MSNHEIYADGARWILQNGRYHLLARSEVADVRYTNHSLMPRDYSSRLSPKELDDIVSFLIVESRNPSQPKAGER